jgi:hypothetical protein
MDAHEVSTKRLESLSSKERDLLQRVMAQHPKLTLDEALQALKEAGM